MGKSEEWRSYLVSNNPTEAATFEDIISHRSTISEHLCLANKSILAAAVKARTWHNRDLQPRAFLGRPIAALPTVEPERRFIGAFQTRS